MHEKRKIVLDFFPKIFVRRFNPFTRRHKSLKSQGRSSDLSLSDAFPTAGAVSGKDCRKVVPLYVERRIYSSEDCPGFPPDSLLIAGVRNTPPNLCTTKIYIFFKKTKKPEKFSKPLLLLLELIVLLDLLEKAALEKSPVIPDAYLPPYAGSPFRVEASNEKAMNTSMVNATSDEPP